MQDRDFIVGVLVAQPGLVAASEGLTAAAGGASTRRRVGWRSEEPVHAPSASSEVTDASVSVERRRRNGPRELPVERDQRRMWTAAQVLRGVSRTTSIHQAGAPLSDRRHS